MINFFSRNKIKVATVVKYFIEDEMEVLITKRVPGIVARNIESSSYKETVEKIALAIKELHEISIDDCPYRYNYEDLLEIEGLSREDVLDLIPEIYEPVITHGDCCLINLLISDKDLYFIDLTEAGISDRYRDIHLILKYISYHFGKEYLEVFLKKYGLSKLDQKRIDFFEFLENRRLR